MPARTIAFLLTILSLIIATELLLIVRITPMFAEHADQAFAVFIISTMAMWTGAAVFAWLVVRHRRTYRRGEGVRPPSR
jgi:hypothetical protein